MFDFFRALFGTDFMPHLYCLRSDPAVLWLEVFSDLAIALAYFAIPIMLFQVIVKRRALLFRRVALLFVVFIAACGATHLLSVWTIWIPVYRLEAVVKAVTAVASVTTAGVLARIRPLIFSLPSISELEDEIRLRERAEAEAREKEVRFRTFVDSVEGYAIHMLSPSGTVLSWNSGAQRMLGYTAEEIEGKSFAVFFGEEECAAGRPEELLRKARESGRSQGEGWRVRKDGSRFLAALHLRPLYESGELLGFSSVTRDLTESRELEEKHRQLLEAAPDAIVIVRQDERVDFLNTQAEKMFQYDRSEVVGKPVEMLVPPRAREAQSGYVEGLFKDPAAPLAPVAPEIFGMRKDGSSFSLEFAVNPLETRDGRLLMFSIRDLTERNRTESQFRSLLEAVPDAIVLMAAPDRIAYVNRRAEELFGFPRVELIGRPADVLVAQRFRAQDRERRRRYLSDPSLTTQDMRWEQVCVRKDGSEFPVEASVNPVETAEGTVLMASVRDLTERNKAETRFRALLESAPDAMVIVDRDGWIVLANLQTERLFGYTRMELAGHSVDILVPPSLQGQHREHRAQYFRSPKRREMGQGLDLMAVRKDGTQFPVEISLSPLEGADATSVTAAIRDISERKLAERKLAEKMTELRQSNEALEQFAHIASHDLQEPLRMVASYTQLLAKRYKGRLDAEADEFIHFAVDGTQRMKRLIEDLLLYSRAGRGGPAPAETSSEHALREAMRNLTAAITESGAQVTWEALPAVRGVELQLVQIFQNLLGNAIKYRGEREPRVHVSAQVSETEWIFSVADNGIGIEPKYFDRIFVIFQRLHGREEYEGTGIGLAICKRILQQQGGRIWVESDPGNGSTFHFSLPKRGHNDAE